ncbi:carbohydrate ABC transporter permease [Paenibacillus lautus]|uniref:Sugar ABC transporter permease n=1 Tax=Paenibacillus lautus TaxID=1401 RepID=A0A385TUL8_PAELA|nr:sugar ABC transporter permease [Paenibacillus lautus]AYB46182.1 sugar ABC transporter permease [Paenibacillus lautus]MBY0163771.1 sugar ABC transporter permease [Cytobacillus firmus]MCI1773972.1 sugar ABC transporter permease [Paenibacillus lautus]VTR19103.1 maltose transporter membrane protein [Actinobacillus pleuropneumoniae]
MFNFSYKTQRYLILFGFLAIPVLLSLTFSYYPALSLLYYSLTDWTGLGWDMNFIGFDNYVEIFTKPEVFSSLKNNLYYLIGGLIQVVFALYFAVILTGKLKGKNGFRVALFLPYVLHSVATVIMFKNVYHMEYGSLNTLLGALGLESWQQSWLGDKGIVNFALAFISMWKYMGLNMVIFIGALQSIPGDLYEAASIDGASGWQKFRYITLPSIRGVLELMLILTLTGALEAFDIPFVMLLGANDTSTFVIKTVDTAFKYQNFGLASAMAVVLLIIVLLFIVIQRKLLFREEKQS